MKYVRIFDNDQGCLYSIKFSEDEPDELDLAFLRWNSPEYLSDFFTQHQPALHRAYPSFSIEEAILRTQHDARLLEQQLIGLSDEKGHGTALDTIFKPLIPNEPATTMLQRSKARGLVKRPGSWLRLYAVRVDAHTYVVAGSAIKLTQTMQEAPHLMQCLNQLNRARDYLKSIGITFREDLGDFYHMDE